MASEWAQKKAEGFVDGIADDVSDIYGSDGRKHWVESLAAALDEAHAKGRAEGLAEGAERERWGCWKAVSDLADDARKKLVRAFPYGCSPGHQVVLHPCAQECADAIDDRGPMRGPEEEE